MSDNNNNNNAIGCVLIIVSMVVSILICQPLISILQDGAYPIIGIVGIFIGKFLSKLFFKENNK